MQTLTTVLWLGVLVGAVGCRGLASYRAAPTPDGPPDALTSRDQAADSKASLDARVERSSDRSSDRSRDGAAPDIEPDLGTDAPTPPDLAADAHESDAVAAASCEALFKASVPGYSICGVTAAGCRFYFYVNGGASCTTLCGSRPCLAMEDLVVGEHCEPEVPMLCGSGPCTCDSVITDGACTCAR